MEGESSALIFCQFQPAVGYKSVAYKKRWIFLWKKTTNKLKIKQTNKQTKKRQHKKKKQRKNKLEKR